jgi:hypothetical protein
MVQQTSKQAGGLLAEPISSTLKIEAIYSSETSVETQRTTRRHIPEDDTLKNSIVLQVSTARQQLACVLYRLHGDSYWTVRWWGNASGQ